MAGGDYRANSVSAFRRRLSGLTANPYTPLDAIGIADVVGATAATGGVVIAGAATASGTLVFYFAGVRVPVGVPLTGALHAGAPMVGQL